MNDKLTKRVWTVTCTANRNVKYEIIGNLKPIVCPACGELAMVKEKHRKSRVTLED